jgi:hypothetical protein
MSPELTRPEPEQQEPVAKPTEAELSDEQLAEVAGGRVGQPVIWTYTVTNTSGCP